ncbi:hypothetical protein BDF14DRAFT_1876392 [Spinellus fusiger]|nr:hypothetical protein BDF14DRAFT_1876392 [Spinellus fusiger]
MTDIFDDNHQHKATISPSGVDYTVQDSDSLVKRQDKDMNLVANILGLPKRHASTLLWYFRWNKEKLFDKYIDAPDNQLSLAGISSIKNTKLVQSKNNLQSLMERYTFKCMICFDDEKEMITVGLACGHRFCIDCYIHYLCINVSECKRRIVCPNEKCNITVDTKTIANLVPDDVLQRYKQHLNRMYVDDNSCLKYCPAVDCQYVIECTMPVNSFQSIIPSVKCACQHVFCFNCILPDHQPALCILVKKWMKICEEDIKSIQWLITNTKPCPGCQTAIEKNGGCNHMICKKCEHHFCWVCMRSWNSHNSNAYNCNQYQGNEVTNNKEQQNAAKRNLDRYQHYYSRYKNHEQSAKLDKALYKIIALKMKKLQNNSNLTWVQIQVFKDAVDVTVKSRSTLKWTYVLAYYLSANNMSALFENNQRDLELATEQLSELLEKPLDMNSIATSRQCIIDRYVYVKQRRETLLKYIAKELIEERLEFTVDITE